MGLQLFEVLNTYVSFKENSRFDIYFLRERQELAEAGLANWDSVEIVLVTCFPFWAHPYPLRSALPPACLSLPPPAEQALHFHSATDDWW